MAGGKPGGGSEGAEGEGDEAAAEAIARDANEGVKAMGEKRLATGEGVEGVLRGEDGAEEVELKPWLLELRLQAANGEWTVIGAATLVRSACSCCLCMSCCIQAAELCCGCWQAAVDRLWLSWRQLWAETGD